MIFDVVLVTLIMNGVNIVVYYIGGIKIIDGQLTAGALTAISIYFSRLYDILNNFIEIPKKRSKAIVAKTRIDQITTNNAPVKLPENNIKKVLSIDLQNISYSIGEKQIIRNLTLHIEAGKPIGIYGSNGSGKSTLARILVKTINPTSGCVLLNGFNYDELDEHFIKEHVLLINAETQLFNDTISNNVTMKLNELSEESKELLNRTGLKENQIVNNTGGGLSSGQKKLIGIARAFSSNSDFVIFDEPLNYIDESNKGFVIDKIGALAKNKTVIIISHEKNIFRLCDRLVEI